MSLSIEPIKSPEQRQDFRQQFLPLFEDHIYGRIPPKPDAVSTLTRTKTGNLQHLSINLKFEDRQMNIDAALWLPDNPANCPVIIALDFLGPLGLTTLPFPLDENAQVCVPEALGGGDRLTEEMRGAMPNRMPVKMLNDAGFAVLVSCYGSWVPDCSKMYPNSGVFPVVRVETGAISMWAWAYSRLIDVAVEILTPSKIIAAGHSRLGKAALWAAAQEVRIDTVFANQSGCFGAAPQRTLVGETPKQLMGRFPHWMAPKTHLSNDLDQHHLLSLIAPRQVYLGQASNDLWANPNGSIDMLRKAAPAWGVTSGFGPNGYHLRNGGHDLNGEDWKMFLKYLM